MAIKAMRSYRTVSHVGATLLVGFPPIELVAGMQSQVFHDTRRLQTEQGSIALRPRDAQHIRTRARLCLMEEWRQLLLDPTINGGRVIKAIYPRMEQLVGRRKGGLSFRATQIITGHGCFSQYLYRIGRDQSTACQNCPSPIDTAQHTLAECEAWTADRKILKTAIGNDLSLPAVIEQILGKEEAWIAFLAFAEKVAAKKGAERIRRVEMTPADPQNADGPHAGRGEGGLRRNRPRPRRGAAHLRA